MNKIDQIKQLFSGFLRANYFEVIIYPPQKLSGQKDASFATFLATSTTFPFETITVLDYQAMCRQYKMASGVDYDPVTVTFKIDSLGVLLDLFQRWKKLIVDERMKVGYYDDYIGKVVIRLLDMKLQNVYEATLHHAFPVNRQGIPLSYDTTDAFAEIDISFNYLYSTYRFMEKDEPTEIDQRGLADIAKIYQNSDIYGVIAEPGRVYQDSRPYGVLSDDYFFSGAGTFTKALQDALKSGEKSINKTLSQVPGNVQTLFSGIIKSQFPTSSGSAGSIQENVYRLQNEITKKYQDMQKKAISRITQGVQNTVKKIFKF